MSPICTVLCFYVQYKDYSDTFLLETVKQKYEILSEHKFTGISVSISVYIYIKQ